MRTSPNSRIFASLVALILLSVSGCGVPSQPSENDGKLALASKIADQAKGRIQLLSFKKTNGQLVKSFGIEAYRMEWEGEVQFLEDCEWGGFRTSESGWSGDFYTAKMGEFLNSPSFEYRASKPKMKGSRMILTGTLSFEKTEKGWRKLPNNL